MKDIPISGTAQSADSTTCTNDEARAVVVASPDCFFPSVP